MSPIDTYNNKYETEFDNGLGSYNYSGYGNVDFQTDEFDESLSVAQKSGTDVYGEILMQLGVTHSQMSQILFEITKSDNTFTFIRIANDFRILYFEDNQGHLTPVPLDKIIQVRNKLGSY